MPGSKQGPTREIFDQGYYLAQLKNKNNELIKEIAKFKDEIEVINKDNTLYVKLEKNYDTLINEVRQLEGELADYNLAQDKYRAGTKQEDILQLYHLIKSQNDKKKQQLDEVFMEKKEMENEQADLEQQIVNIQRANEEKLNELDPEKRQQYEQLKAQNETYLREINNMRSELDQLNMMIQRADSQLKEDFLRQRAYYLKQEKQQLLRKKEELQLQTNEFNLPFPEARERLIARIKQDNTQYLTYEKQIVDMKKLIENYEKNIKEIDQELEESGSTGESDDKYAILHKKDQEMMEYMDGFEENRDKEMKQVQELEDTIPKILEHMSSQITRQTALPSREQVKDKKENADYQKGLVENSEDTLARIRMELETRQNDLEKIKNLEVKIEKENQQMNEKLEKMEDEMANKFPNVGNMKNQIEQDKKDMIIMKKML